MPTGISVTSVMVTLECGVCYFLSWTAEDKLLPVGARHSEKCVTVLENHIILFTGRVISAFAVQAVKIRFRQHIFGTFRSGMASSIYYSFLAHSAR
jgi:hypothetical protein